MLAVAGVASTQLKANSYVFLSSLYPKINNIRPSMKIAFRNMLKPPTILPMGLVFQPAGTKRVYYMGLMGGSKMTGCQRTLHTSHRSEREIENKGENGRVKERTTHPKLG